MSKLSRKNRDLIAFLLIIASLLLFIVAPAWCLVPWACF